MGFVGSGGLGVTGFWCAGCVLGICRGLLWWCGCCIACGECFRGFGVGDVVLAWGGVLGVYCMEMLGCRLLGLGLHRGVLFGLGLEVFCVVWWLSGWV